MADFAMLKVPTRINQHMFDGAVLGAHAGLITSENFPAEQTGQDILDDRLVGIELCDVATDVLVGRIAKKLELGSIGLENGAVCAHEMERYRSIVKEVFEIEGCRVIAHLAICATESAGWSR
jgi:hypothetical protein